MKAETIRQKAIVDYLTMQGFEVLRINSGTVKVKRGWMHNAKKGTPDILCIRQGRCVFFEVKEPKKAPTKEQMKRQEELRRAGCHVVNVTSLDDVETTLLYLTLNDLPSRAARATLLSSWVAKQKVDLATADTLTSMVYT